MSLININKLTFSYDNNYENIFEDVSLQLDTDWKLGLIGKNGKGKTTFLKLLQNQLDYSGTIVSQVNFEYFPLDILDEGNLVETIIEGYLYDIEKWRVKKELNLLNLDENILYQTYSSLSGGEKVKIMLITLFLKENNFLLIDEPTNHLDIEGRAIVSEYLNSKKGFILISHDRNFLNNCIDHVMSINNTSIEIQQGNYDTWKENKDNIDNYEIAKNSKLKKDISRLKISAKRTEKWSNNVEKSKNLGVNSRNGKIDQGVKPDKGHIGAMAAKMMKHSKNSQKRIEKMVDEKKKLLKEIDTIEPLKLNLEVHHSNELVSFNNVEIYYDEKMINCGINFSIKQGERIALLGNNGCGKSSVLKLIIGYNIEYCGEINLASNLKVSYVSQDIDFLKGKLVDYIRNNSIDESKFKSILRKLGFSRNQFEKDINDYSSGQKKKILLAKSLCDKAHLYVWDEALNYLDIISRIQLENLLLEYKPTIIFVEHDVEFCENIATKTIYLS